MRNVRILNIEERRTHINALRYACAVIVNVAKYCGRTVQTTANKLFTSAATYTHSPQPRHFKNLSLGLCTFYELLTRSVVHTKSMQFISVSGGLYTQSTGPTITTTLINK